MRRLLVMLILLLPLGLRAQTDDRTLLLEADFTPLLSREAPPEGISPIEKSMYRMNLQLTGRCYFNPPCYLFYSQAVRDLGFLRGSFATVDRLLRCSRIGTARVHFDPADPHIHEGTEAYLPERRQR